MTREELKKLHVAVIAGGWSDEHEISMESGSQCADALREAGFIGVDLLDVAAEEFIVTLAKGDYDVAYVAMHGRFGEDGCIQGLLEILHIPYTFSGVLASAIGTEKELTKLMYRQAGVLTPKGIDVASGTVLSDEQTDKLIADFGLPLFVKPSGNGSSYGVTRVTSREELPAALKLAGEQGERILIEECITGTEITVPVIGNERPTALPIVEIVTGDEFYSIKTKYEPASMHHVIPARRAHSALGCRGVSRTDFIVTNAGEPIALETNMIPGMTARSLLPDSARIGGIDFPELCTRFIEFALEGHK